MRLTFAVLPGLLREPAVDLSSPGTEDLAAVINLRRQGLDARFHHDTTRDPALARI